MPTSMLIIVHPSEFYLNGANGLDKKIAEAIACKSKEGYQLLVLKDNYCIMPNIADALKNVPTEYISYDNLYPYEKMEHQSFITKEFLLKNNVTFAKIVGFTGFCTDILKDFLNGERYKLYEWRHENEVPDILDKIIKDKEIEDILSEHIECSLCDELILEPLRQH